MFTGRLFFYRFTGSNLLRSALFCLISAGLVAGAFFSFRPGSMFFGVLLPVALGPLYAILAGSGARPSALDAPKKTFSKFFGTYFWNIGWVWLFGFLVEAISFFWITKPFIYFTNLPSWASYSLFLFIAIVSAFYFVCLFLPAIVLLPGKKISLLSCLPLAGSMTLLEIIWPRFFDWTFGSLLSSYPTFAQINSLCGFHTGSLFVFFGGLCASFWFRSPLQPLASGDTRTRSTHFFRRFLLPLVGIGGVYGVLFGYGYFHSQRVVQNEAQVPRFRVAFVQPNFGFSYLASRPLPFSQPQAPDHNFSDLIYQSYKVIQDAQRFDGRKPDVVVWPESAAPYSILWNPLAADAVAALSRRTGVPFLVQAVERSPSFGGQGHETIWSSTAVIGPEGVRRPFFRKWIPMPFGEELPLEHIFPAVGEWYRRVFENASTILRGTDHHALPVDGRVFVTPLICFDAISQKLGYLSTNQGHADFFVNQANFVWMVDSNAGYELAILDQMRAIENGRSLVIVANTGPSLAFDAAGRLLSHPTALLTQTTGFIDVPLYTLTTIFQRFYVWPLLALSLLSAAWCLGRYRRL